MAKKKSVSPKHPGRETNELQELVDLNSGMAMLIDGQHLTGVEAQLHEIHGMLEMILSVLEKQAVPNASVRRRRSS